MRFTVKGSATCIRPPITAPLPSTKQRLASPSDVIDLGKIKELIGIEASADTLTIKAATHYFDIMTSAEVKSMLASTRPIDAMPTTTRTTPAIAGRPRSRRPIAQAIQNYSALEIACGRDPSHVGVSDRVGIDRRVILGSEDRDDCRGIDDHAGSPRSS